MSAENGDADASGRNTNVRVVEDLAGLVGHLDLLLAVAVGRVDVGVVAEHVPHVLATPELLGEGLAGNPVTGLSFKLLHGGRAGARRSLVGGGDHAGDLVLLVEGPDGDVHDDRRAVRVRNDTLVLLDRLRVDLRHHKRGVRVHAERRRVVDDHGAGLHGRGAELLGATATSGKQSDVHVLEGIMGQLLDGVALAVEFHLLAGGTSRGEKLERLHGKVALGKNLEHALPNSASSARNGDARLLG
mmetsp:Transcript_56523/g.133146  ORF Transcript_56523/g.133146 Transcript_56523/m.133146 type:complete len:244 (-) Transcript_56523:66-797(-)